MKCLICKDGETRPGFASLTLERGGATVVFKQVPAEICDNCQEVFHGDGVTAEVMCQAQAAIAAGVELGVPRYATAA